MLLRLVRLVFFASIVPIIAFAPAHSRLPRNSSRAEAIFQLAKKEMPLPVLRVTTVPSAQGKQRFVVEMSTAGLPWAKQPVCRVMFQTSEDDGIGFEQALQEASAFAKAFIEAAKDNPALQNARWY